MWGTFACLTSPYRTFRGIVSDTSVQACDVTVTLPSLCTPTHAVSVVHYGGCVFGYWYMWGVMQSAPAHEVMQCVSGSALAAVVHACGCVVDEQIVICASLRHYVARNPMCVFTIVREWLMQILPTDCAARCKGRVHILVRSMCTCTVHSFTEWTDKRDLIECLLVACSPLPTRYRAGIYMDCVRHTRTPAVRAPSRMVAYVPTKAQALMMFQEGERDGRHFRQHMGTCE